MEQIINIQDSLNASSNDDYITLQMPDLKHDELEIFFHLLLSVSEDNPDCIIQFNLKDYPDLNVQQILDNLQRKILNVTNTFSDTLSFAVLPMFSYVCIHHTSKVISVKFNQFIIPFLIQLRKCLLNN